jgi:hypothetical protein
MTNNSEQQRKESVLKSLAIAGFVGLIIVISWLAIQLVQVAPQAFSSLASLADSVYRYEPATLTVMSNKSQTATDEPVIISWNTLDRAGTFAFSYECIDGLALDMKDAQGTIKSLTCDTSYNIGSVQSLELIAMSEKTRFTDLAYQIDFIPSGKSEPFGSDTDTITVINDAISTNPVVVTPTTPTTTPATPETPVVVKPATPTTPAKPATPVVTKPVYTEVFGIPTSDPNGTIDLVTSYAGAGSLEGAYFRNLGLIDNDARGAIQFVVKNKGTKTSNSWTYVVKLPTGDTYTSPSQVALRPSESAVITIGFTPGLTGTKSYSVTVNTTSDVATTNNGFSNTVIITE